MAGKKKPRIPVKGINIKLKMINDLMDVTGSAKDSWNPAEISDDMKVISYIHDLADTWNPAQLNEALKYLGFATIDSWNPAIIEETKNKLVKYFLPTNASGNPIELDLKGALPYEATSLTIDLLPIQDLSQGEPSPTNICPISGRTQVSVNRGSVDITTLYNGQIGSAGDFTRNNNRISNVNNTQMNTCFLKKGTHTLTFKKLNQNAPNLVECTVLTKNDNFEIVDNFATVWHSLPYTFELTADAYVYFTARKDFGTTLNTADYKALIIDETYTETLGQTVYGGKVDFVSGEMSVEWGYIASYNGETLPSVWISDRDVYAPNTTPTTGAEVAYKLATPATITLTPEEISLLNGNNTLSTDGDNINITYKAILNS